MNNERRLQTRSLSWLRMAGVACVVTTGLVAASTTVVGATDHEEALAVSPCGGDLDVSFGKVAEPTPDDDLDSRSLSLTLDGEIASSKELATDADGPTRDGSSLGQVKEVDTTGGGTVDPSDDPSLFPCPQIDLIEVLDSGQGGVSGYAEASIPVPPQPFQPSYIHHLVWTIDGGSPTVVDVGDLLWAETPPGERKVCVRAVDVWARTSEAECVTLHVEPPPPPGPNEPYLHLDWVGEVEPGDQVIFEASTWSLHDHPEGGFDDRVIEEIWFGRCDDSMEWTGSGPMSGLGLGWTTWSTSITWSATAGAVDGDEHWCVEVVDHWLSDPSLGDFRRRKSTTVQVRTRYCGQKIDWWEDHGRVFTLDGPSMFHATDGHDLIFGTEYDDTIYSYEGDDCIFGGGGDDRILSGDGNDTVEAGAGNDVVLTGSGSDTVDGGDGADTLKSDVDSNGEGISAGAGGQDIDDVLFGGPGNDIIWGGAYGADRLDGGSGQDSIYGNLTMSYPGPRFTEIRGGSGHDLIRGGMRVFGGPGNDDAECPRHGCEVSGDEGADTLFCEASFGCHMDGGGGADVLHLLEDTAGTLNGGPGDDELFGSNQYSILRGGPGDDFIEGGSAGEFIDGGTGVDLLLGKGGDDTIRGGGDDDEVHGGPGADFLFGEDGDDLLVGGALSPNMAYWLSDPGDLADVLDGGAGDDTAWGNRDVAPNVAPVIIGLILGVSSPAGAALALGYELFLDNDPPSWSPLTMSDVGAITWEVIMAMLQGRAAQTGSPVNFADVISLFSYLFAVGADPFGELGDICLWVEDPHSCESG